MTPYFARAYLSVALILTALGGSQAWSADIPAQPTTNERTERVFVYGGSDFNSFNSYFTWVGSTIAPFGLDSSGVRLGGFAGVGQYKYETGGGFTNNGRVYTVDGLVGWAVATENMNTKFMIGANFQDQVLGSPDPNNPVQGTRTGFKAQVDTYIQPTKETTFFALGSYSTAFRTYYTEAKVGVAVQRDSEVYIGPQFIALGNQRFNQWRAGLHLSGMKLGIISVDLAGGFLRESDLGNGAYGMISADVRF